MPAPRPLYLYKFHSADCKVHSIKGLSASAKKFYFACDCPIWLTGTTAKGEFVPRQATGLRDKEAAEAHLANFNKDVATEILAGQKGITIAEAVQKFLDGHHENVGKRALGQHELTLGRLKTYATSQGLTFAEDLTYDVCKDFLTYGLPSTITGTTKATYRAKLKVFLAEAHTRKWIKDDFVRKIKNVYSEPEEREPYTDKEIDCLMSNAGRINGGRNGYASNGKTFRLLLEFMLETGVRVSDAVRYDPAKAVKSTKQPGTWRYTFFPKKQAKAKKKKALTAYLPEKFKIAIDEAEWFSTGRPFLYTTIENHDDTGHEQSVLERMGAIGGKCGIADCGPHRLRHTFAVRKLLAGWQMEDVSKALGHASVKTTENHYAKWTPEREDRLEGLAASTSTRWV